MQIIRNKIHELAKRHRSSVDVEVLADTLFYRLTIIRLGEEDNNAWWESSILSEVGRRNLESFFPNTFHKQRYEIARKIIIEKENREIIEKRYTTLFNFGYEFETEIFEPFIKEISNHEEWKEILSMIEKIKENKFISPWARKFYGISKLPTYYLENEGIIELGNVPQTFYNSKESFEEIITIFISVYDLCTLGRVVTPYYNRRMAI